MSVGKAVLRLRQERGLTQNEVGRRARLATSYISRIENERIHPTMVTLSRLAEALQVATADLFRVAESPDAARLHSCPVSSSGQCVGELIRSGRGRRPSGGGITYGPEELRLLRMADYVVLHGSKDVRGALAVMLECFVNEASRGRCKPPPPEAP